MEIRQYRPADESLLFGMLSDEGEEWKDYSADDEREHYKRTLQSSLTYVAYDGDILCGYARCRDDDGYGIYVYDLLVKKSCRGQNIGKKIMNGSVPTIPTKRCM